MKKYVLAINPGSTTTKVAIFEGEKNLIQKDLVHERSDLEKFAKITDQFSYRKDMIINWVKTEGYSLNEFISIVGRGGLIRSIPSGIYAVSDLMVEDLKIGIQGEHASNLGGLISKAIGDELGIPSYIVDPVAVDEFEDIARISGIKEIARKSLVHALNIKATAYRVAKEKHKKVEDLNMVIAHLGGGISIVPLRKGRIVDANDANEMGPFSPERSGSLPTSELAKLCFSGKYESFKDFKPTIRGKGGLYSYLGTSDLREAEKMMETDDYAKLIVDAMAYQIAKEIGAMATVMDGQVDYIILTGGMAYSKYLTSKIIKSVKFIAEVLVEAGEDEMRALNEGVLRVLDGEPVKVYDDEIVQ